MSIHERAFQYRGNIRALVSTGKMLVWTTEHPQKLPTGIFQLNTESLDFSEIALPCGGVSLLATEKHFWVGGDDRKLYQLSGKSIKAVCELPRVAIELAELSENRLAAIAGNELLVVDTTKGSLLQSIQLSEMATALAADPTGQWMAVGLNNGVVSVYECEDKKEYLQSESAKLHTGAITSLLFEIEELRFLSAGADQKLLLTHARGKLEPEDRGRSSNHTERVVAIVHAPGDRFITGSKDKTCKSWARSGASKPSTLSDGVVEVVDMTLVSIHNRPHLALAGRDNSVRLFLLDAGGKFGAATHRITDAYDRATKLLAQDDTTQRSEGISALASYGDDRAAEMLAAHATSEKDHGLRLQATESLIASSRPIATKLLQPLLKHDDAAIRLAVFAGLCQRVWTDPIEPMRLALKANLANVGVAAVNRLAELATKDENANRLLIESISHGVAEVRVASQMLLEKVLGASSPEANLIALTAKQADARSLALVRMFQRKMLADRRVEAAIRRAGEDADAVVRQHAFMVGLLSKERLAAVLRFREVGIHRQLHNLESIQSEPATTEAKELPKAAKADFELTTDEISPLLTAMASRAMDTSLRGACGLALLGDPRSLGMLLQLSREEDVVARCEVCAALAALGDERSIQRLESLLDDDAETVRDAAFTAYSKVTRDETLRASTAGIASKHEDVRRRALQTLVAFLRKSASNQKHVPARDLLVQALNDSAVSVRSEALKASLNLEIDGGAADTLRFVLQSVHADVRREVLTEVIAQEKLPWAWTLLLELMSDPDAVIRKDAFEHANHKEKKNDLTPLQTALKSPHADVRMQAVVRLKELATSESQVVLASAFEDADREVRLAALKAIIDRAAVDALQAAMSSAHQDVRLMAATARAAQGDASSRDSLLEFVRVAEPEDTEAKGRWKETLKQALSGLSSLGDSSIIDEIVPLLTHKDGDLRCAATGVIADFLDSSGAEHLKARLRDEDKSVKVRAAHGLSICGESASMPVVFSVLQADANYPYFKAAVNFGDTSERRLLDCLDSKEDAIRTAALLVLLSRDLLDHDGTPRRALACLSVRNPRVRLVAAEAVEAFGDNTAFEAVLVSLVNDRGDAPAWEVPQSDIEALSRLIVFGTAAIRDRALNVCQFLTAEKQAVWDQNWKLVHDKFSSDKELAKRASAKTLPKLRVDANELKQLALGTYIALVREQGSYHGKGKRPASGEPVISIRQTALRRLALLAANDPAIEAVVRPVMIQSLGDPNQAVRTLAFEKLETLKVDADTRAFLAIESGHADLAVAGMQLLTRDAKLDNVRKILGDVILTRTDSLAFEAARLYSEKTNKTAAASVAIESPAETLRIAAVAWLVDEYDQEEKAKQQLRSALNSKYANVKKQAAIGLASKRDSDSYDALVALLREDQPLAVNGLTLLRDPRGADAAMDRIENDSDKSANQALLFGLIGSFRNPKNAERLLGMMDKANLRPAAAQTLLTISGFDQPVEDPLDERIDKSWLDEQHPRHVHVLAKLLNRHLEVDWLPKTLPQLIEQARWSSGNEVDEPLARLTKCADESIRRSSVAALGWRVKRRAAKPEPLIEALENRDPETKFLAAEGLALAGRHQGIQVLLSAVELLSDLSLRHRAVSALGELADPIAVEVLLRLASDDAHALQESAAVAIGHMGKTSESRKIFDLLKRLAAQKGAIAARAIRGLRYFDSADGWVLIRQTAADENSCCRAVAIEQLQYNNDPATKDLLLELISQGNWTPAQLASTRRLFGMESLEPDYAALKGNYELTLEPHNRCLHRVCEAGEPARMIELIPKTNVGVRAALASNLVSRDPLPIALALPALEDSHPAAVEVAAHLLGRAAEKVHGKAMVAAMQKWHEQWEASYARPQSTSLQLPEVTRCLCRLVWACGRCQAGKAELLTLLEKHLSDVEYLPVRTTAIGAISCLKLAAADLSKLTAMLDDSAVEIRCAVAELIAGDSKSVSSVAEQSLSDRRMFERVTRVAQSKDLNAVMSKAVGQLHRQPIVIPQLVIAKQVDALAKVIHDPAADELARRGAIEALGQIASQESQKEIEKFAKTEGNEEELRKVAWRTLRKNKRLTSAK
jgi:ParB family transcriptional regulator, chromosome partitioning protein